MRFNVPPLFIAPPPCEREHVPRGSVPPSRLAGAVVKQSTFPPATRIFTFHAVACAQYVLNREAEGTVPNVLSLVAAARGGGQLRAGQWLSRLPRPSTRESRRGCDASYASRPGQDWLALATSRMSGPRESLGVQSGTTAVPLYVPPSWEHADVPPSLKCTPLLRLYPLPWSRSAM